MANIRYYKLKNKAAFVARMKIKWTHSDSKGDTSTGDYEPSGYHDVCAGAERTIDMNDTNIPDGAEVQLEVKVVLGTDKTASEKHSYQKSFGDMATYEITGTTLISKLKETS